MSLTVQFSLLSRSYFRKHYYVTHEKLARLFSYPLSTILPGVAVGSVSRLGRLGHGSARTTLRHVRALAQRTSPCSSSSTLPMLCFLTREQPAKPSDVASHRTRMLWYTPIASPLSILLWQSKKLAQKLKAPSEKFTSQEEITLCSGAVRPEYHPVSSCMSHMYDIGHPTACLSNSQCNSQEMQNFSNLPTKWDVGHIIEKLTISSDVKPFVDQLKCDNNYVQSYTYTAENDLQTSLLMATEDLALDGRYLDSVFKIKSDINEVNDNLYPSSFTNTLHEDNDDGDNKALTVFYDDNLISRDNCEVHFPWERPIAQAGKVTDLIGNIVLAEPNPLVQSVPLEDVKCFSHVIYSVKDPVLSPSGSSNNMNKKTDKSPSKPNMDQLRQVQDYLSENLQHLFVRRHDYRVYQQDVMFENNFFEKPYTTRGVSRYAIEIAKFRMYMTFKYANVRIEILKTTVSEDEGSVMVRWRVKGIPQTRAFMFWKFLPWKYAKSQNVEAEWIDGFSTFYVDSDSLVYKHKLDRVIPEQKEVVEATEAPALS